MTTNNNFDNNRYLLNSIIITVTIIIICESLFSAVWTTKVRLRGNLAPAWALLPQNKFT